MLSRKFLQNIPVGERLRHFRKLKGFTQKYVTTQMQIYGSNLSSSVYSKIELGTNNIFFEDFVLLKMILGFSYDEFFEPFENNILNSLK